METLGCERIWLVVFGRLLFDRRTSVSWPKRVRAAKKAGGKTDDTGLLVVEFPPFPIPPIFVILSS
ncbi:MAG: hypothetical protein LBR16_07810 [Treponema sp.]|jgi:hypothetical protein|nr:hypothetical protein [Treponema sp.]